MGIESLPVKNILKFQSLDAIGIDRLHSYYFNCNYPICEYSVGVKKMWEREYHYAFAEACGCLICRGEAKGNLWFDYPVAGEAGDINGALQAIEEYCMEKEIPLRFTTLPKEALPILCDRYEGISLQKTNLCRDYFYLTEEINSFEGKKFSGQRNHIRKFQKLYPTATFHPLSAGDEEKLTRFFNRFNASFHKEADEANYEKDVAFQTLLQENHGIFVAGCLEYEGEIIGVSLGEVCGKTLVIHIEKALASEFEGVYPTLFQAFVKEFAGNCKYLNREDDAADAGLRTSKMQYHPVFLSEKFDAQVYNSLHFLEESPEIKTENLLLCPLTEGDAAEYLCLSLDEENNRYWGYDLCAEFGREPTPKELFDLVRTDFQKRQNLVFCIRHEDSMVGEAILYSFDYQGECEVGIRLFRKYQKRGFAGEALQAVLHWALYNLGCTLVKAKCFRQNASCAKLLAKEMKAVAEDEKMLYFEKRI